MSWMLNKIYHRRHCLLELLVASKQFSFRKAVLEVSKHPGADKLNVCSVDVGSGTPQQIVCGAPNVVAGMKAPGKDAVAREAAAHGDAELLARVGDPDLTADEVADLQALFVSTGALDVVEAEIAALAAKATGALPAIRLPEHAELALRDLADFVVARDA